jgi:hypothetical protein
MEREVVLGDQRVRFDREATIELYRDFIKVAGSERCTCIYCKNFAAQRTKIFPEAFLHFLKELGMDPHREWETFEYGPENPQNRLYGGWFIFCGELIDGGDQKHSDLGTGNLTYWFATSFPNATLPKSTKLCAVEFLARIPWILPENPE